MDIDSEQDIVVASIAKVRDTDPDGTPINEKDVPQDDILEDNEENEAE